MTARQARALYCGCRYTTGTQYTAEFYQHRVVWMFRQWERKITRTLVGAVLTITVLS